MTTQAAPRNQELRETASGLEMYDATTQTWWPVELWGNIDDAILERLYSSQDVAGRTFNEVLGGAAGGGGQGATGGKPPWWDALVAATGGNLPSFEDIGDDKDDNDNTVYNIVKANQVLKAASDMAKSLGLVQEEQGQEGLTPEQEQAILDEFPNKVVDIDKNGNRTFIDKPVVEESAAPRTFPKPADAHAFAAQSGLNPGDYNLAWAVNGWQITVDPIRGQQHTSFQQAERNKPPGFKTVPITLNDGSQVWGYDEADPTPKQKFSSFDDLILQRFTEGASMEEIARIDAFRDMVNSPRVTPLQAFEFALSAGAKTAEEFKALAGLVMSASQQNTFAQDIQSASFAFGQAQSGQQVAGIPQLGPVQGGAFGTSTGLTLPGGVPTNEFVAGLAAAAARDRAVAQGLDPAEAEQVANDTLAQQMERLDDQAKVIDERRLDPFSPVRFGVNEADGVTTTTQEMFGGGPIFDPGQRFASLTRTNERGITGTFNNLGASEALALQGNTPEQIAGRQRRAEREAMPVAAASASRDFAAELGQSIADIQAKRRAERPRRARTTRVS